MVSRVKPLSGATAVIMHIRGFGFLGRSLSLAVRWNDGRDQSQLSVFFPPSNARDGHGGGDS